MVPEPIKEKLDCDESETLVYHCEQWSNELASSYPHRKVKCIFLSSINAA